MKTLSFYLNQETENSNLTVASASFDIENDATINFEKLAKSLTKTVFSKVEATKKGIKTGIKTSLPFNLIVTASTEGKIENILNLQDIAAFSSMEDQIKVSTALLAKDPAAAKERFESTVLYVINSHREFNEDVLGCIE